MPENRRVTDSDASGVVSVSHEIRRMTVADLKPAPYNPRRIDSVALAGLTKSIERFGNVQPVVWNQRSGFVVGGHQRLKVLRANKVMTTEVVVVDLDEKEERALNVALNNPHIAGEFTADLQRLLEEIKADDAAFFADLRLDELLVDTEPEGQTVDPDAIPLPPKVRKTKPGDVYLLGDHRLICGDCRDEAVLAKLFAGKTMNLAMTSPPYAAQRDYDDASGFKPIPPAEYSQWFRGVADALRLHLAADGSFCVNIKEHAESGQRSLYVKELVIAFVREWDWRLVEEFSWSHGGTPKTPRGRLKNGFEPIFHFAIAPKIKWRPKHVRHQTDDIPDWGGLHPSQLDGLAMKGYRQRVATSKAQGRSHEETGNPARLAPATDLAYPSNVIECGKNHEALGHGAVFPVALPTFFIRLLTDAGDRVFDPFAGAGTTLIACERERRMGYACEISAAYCDIIVERWQQLTGKKATRA
jgi:DNA modification methylase